MKTEPKLAQRLALIPLCESDRRQLDAFLARPQAPIDPAIITFHRLVVELIGWARNGCVGCRLRPGTRVRRCQALSNHSWLPLCGSQACLNRWDFYRNRRPWLPATVARIFDVVDEINKLASTAEMAEVRNWELDNPFDPEPSGAHWGWHAEPVTNPNGQTGVHIVRDDSFSALFDNRCHPLEIQKANSKGAKRHAN